MILDLAMAYLVAISPLDLNKMIVPDDFHACFLPFFKSRRHVLPVSLTSAHIHNPYYTFLVLVIFKRKKFQTPVSRHQWVLVLASSPYQNLTLNSKKNLVRELNVG